MPVCFLNLIPRNHIYQDMAVAVILCGFDWMNIWLNNWLVNGPGWWVGVWGGGLIYHFKLNKAHSKALVSI